MPSRLTLNFIRVNFRTLVFLIASTYVLCQKREGCLDFVETSRLPECYHGAFTCLGEVNTNCHIAEHQLHMTISDGLEFSDGPHLQKSKNIVKFKFQNDGLHDSAIETIWIEDEYKLLGDFLRRGGIKTSNPDRLQYKKLSNETYFDDAYANFIPFDQHFVVGCQSSQQTGNLRRHTIDEEQQCVQNVFVPPPIRNYKEIDEKDNEKFEFDDDVSAYVIKEEYKEEPQDLTLKFDTQCSIKDIRKAVRLGLIRIGTKMGGFRTRPNHKSLLSCPDVINIEDFNEERAFNSLEEDSEEYYEKDEKTYRHLSNREDDPDDEHYYI
jgi:hypothetical protein